MHTELHTLKICIEQVLAKPPTNPSALLSDVTIECERLKGFLFAVFNKVEDLTKATDILNWYRVSATKLANSLWDASNVGNLVAAQILLLVIGLVTHVEEEYGDLLDRSHALPAFILQELSKQVSVELREIQERLQQKYISAPLIEQLVKAHTDLFKPTKYPALCYAEKNYLHVFLPQLKALAFDEREKDWNKRLRQLLIKYNFNHMGVYKFLKTEDLKDAEFVKQCGAKKGFLRGRRKWLSEVQVIPNLAFNPAATTLKKLLIRNLTHAQLLEKEGKEQTIRFDPNLNVDELALIFNYQYKIGLPRYATKKEAAMAFCASIRSKETNPISFHSLLKTEKMERANGAKRLFKFLKQIMDELRSDFEI